MPALASKTLKTELSVCQAPKNMAFDLFQKLGIDFLLFVCYIVLYLP